jgi:histidyl-tRNA synthetase
MSEKQLSAPIGTKDVLPPESAQWEDVTAVFAQLAFQYGFRLIATPMFEDVAVFHRGIGEGSDVARKEMYVFEDRGGRTFALRPEGTASVVRAYVQHHPTPPWKVWYLTPAFRYERPQAGRYRQHHQFGVEALGTDDPFLDVEVIALAAAFYRAVGLTKVRLLLNSMGHAACRSVFVEALRDFLEKNVVGLCEEHQKSWSTNPLRVIDCKKDACRSVLDGGPQLPDFLCHECENHFAVVKDGLTALGVPFTLAPRLVRGFDYYTRTTFEFVAEALEGAQNAVGGGGRYDQLAEDLGGEPTSGIGFGCGVERLLLAREAEGLSGTVLVRRVLDAFVVDTTGGAEALQVLHELRVAGFAVDRAYDQRSMRAQIKAADRSGAAVVILIGPQERESGTVSMRDLRSTEEAAPQRVVARSEIVQALRQYRGTES